MREIRCPKCQSVFQVDEADYASIVSQVKNAEFDIEINKRIEELRKQYVAEQKAVVLKSEQGFQEKLSARELELGKKEREIERLNAQINALTQTKELEMKAALGQKEQEISALKLTISQSDSKRQIALLEEQRKAQDVLKAKDAKIAELEGKVKLEQSEASLRENSLRKEYEYQL